MNWILGLADQDLKDVIKTMFQDISENILVINEQIENFQLRNKNYKMNH